MADAETMKKIRDWIGPPTLDEVIDAAMARHSVRRGRRPYVAAVIREAFEIAANKVLDLPKTQTHADSPRRMEE